MVTEGEDNTTELTQGVLLPVDDEEAQLVEYGGLYETLSEQQRRLVRGYIRGVRLHGADFQVKHWVECCGMPRSTFYDRLRSEDMVGVASATREAMALTGQTDCARAGLVLGKAVLYIERQIDQGKATLEDLVKAMGVLQHAIAFASGALPGSSTIRSRARVSLEDAHGRRISMEVEGGNAEAEDDVTRALSRLQGERRETLRAAARAGEPESVRAGENGAIDVPATPVAEAAG